MKKGLAGFLAAVTAVILQAALALSCAGSPSPRASANPSPSGTVDVTLIVTAPKSTPADAILYLGSSANGWNPGDLAWSLKPGPVGVWSGTFALEAGSILEFKITRGDWETVEKAADGTELDNRVLETGEAAGTAVTVRIEVANWRDQVEERPRPGSVVGALVIVKDFGMPELGTVRTLRIWLPPGYEGSTRRYPVLYMHDGQNLFDRGTSFAGEWRIDEAMTAFAARTDGPGAAIVVGIDNGGGERLNEYSPFIDPHAPSPKGDSYVAFLVSTLKPWVDTNYRTLPDRRDTTIGGSSMGGLISLYAALRHPEVFSEALCMSSAFWFGDNALRKLILTEGIAGDLRIYLDVGGREGSDKEGRSMVADSRDMYEALLGAGIPVSDLRLVIDPQAAHNEAFWARRFPAAWEWMRR